MTDLVTLLHGDCLEVMPTLEAESVDAVVTDPPYGITFMGKAWDGPAIAEAARRDAETRKSLGPHSETRPGRAAPRSSSAFGSPASAAGAYDFSVRGNRAFQAWCEQWGREALRVTKPGGYLLAFGGTRTHHRLVCALEDAGWIIRDELDWIYASGFPKGKANLKPAHEPIVLARKPGPLCPLAIDECRIGTDGGHEGAGPGPSQGILGEELNGSRAEPIPGMGRWPSNVLLSDPELFDQPNPYVVGSGATAGDKGGGFYIQPPGKKSYEGPAYVGASKGQHINAAGREPFHYGDSGGYSRFFKIPERGNDEPQTLVGGEQRVELSGVPQVAVGSPQDAQGLPPEPEPTHPSHFIIPKADRAERNRGLTGRSSHPTVKPIDLMRHLVRLVTPPGGLILDPFLGSGTTALAASEEGFSCIGIEREAEYLDIARARLTATPIGMGL